MEMDQIIIAYHTQKATNSEKRTLLAWLKESEENKKYFQDLSNIWYASHQESPTKITSALEAYGQFSAQIKFKQHRSYSVMRWMAAAVMIGVVILGLVKFGEKKVELLSYDTVVEDVLPDGTIVSLNKNSKVTYQQYALWGARNVTMEGEVYFKVAKDPSHPFKISARDLLIRVVGTSFNVNATNKTMSVFVNEGIVDVGWNMGKSGFDETRRLVAGSFLVANNENYTFEDQATCDVNSLMWRTHALVFDQQPLVSVIRMLESRFNVQIKTDESVDMFRELNAQFPDTASLSSIIQVIELSLDIKLHVR